MSGREEKRVKRKKLLASAPHTTWDLKNGYVASLLKVDEKE